jgi:hypothetical protein
MYYMCLDLQTKLLSMCQSTQKGGCISFYHKFCEIELIYTKNGDLITFKCAQTEILYVVGTSIKVNRISNMATTYLIKRH